MIAIFVILLWCGIILWLIKNFFKDFTDEEKEEIIKRINNEIFH